MKKIFLLILPLVLSLNACINEPEAPKNTYESNFEALWKIIDTRYCYLDYKNINWDSVHTVYKARVDTNMTEYQFFDLLGEMLGELKDGHVNLYSNFNRSRYWKWFSDYPANFSSGIVYSDRYLGDNYYVAGGMRYGKIAGDSIGYIYYGDFSDQFSDTNISYIFKYLSDCKALIVDVRNNGGGYLNLSEQLASYFFEQEMITGYIQHKVGNGHSDFSEMKELKTPSHKTIQWRRPVAVLSNRMSYSATNSFISRMKMVPNAILVGDKSGGGGGLPLSSEIPNGWMVRFSSVPMYDANKDHIEWGIEPHIKVDMSAEDIERGVDSIIEKAVEELKKRI